MGVSFVFAVVALVLHAVPCAVPGAVLVKEFCFLFFFIVLKIGNLFTFFRNLESGNFFTSYQYFNLPGFSTFKWRIRRSKVKSMLESINMINMINMKGISKVRLKFNRKICTKIFYNFVQLFRANL